jgi:transposase
MEDAAVQEIVNGWQKKNQQIGALVALYFDRTTKRIEYGQAQVAHDLCRYLKEKGTGRLVVESNFLAKVSRQHDNEDPVSLKRSQKYRQFAAPGKFVAVLKNTAVKYGIVVDEHENVNITRMCNYCKYLNPATEKEKFNCEGCGREIKRDQNAAINLSRSGSAPELAEMALQAEREE